MRRVARSRLTTLEQRLHPEHERSGRLVFCCVERWPIEAQGAWDAACQAGDLKQQEDLVERYEGTRPWLGGPDISLILVPPPPDDTTQSPGMDAEA